MMKLNTSDFIAAATLVILVGYISYDASRSPLRTAGAISDQSTMMVDLEDASHPLPAVSFDVPQGITFAGEPVPLDIPDVRERLDKELQINVYFHSNTIFLIKRANRWLPQMEKILKEHGIPEDFMYLPLIESNLLNAVSPKHAVGYWQILEDSGRELGLEISREVDERYDPLKATEAACKYLRRAYNKFQNWTIVAASYNRGMAGMQRALDDQKVDSYYDLYLNEETSRYVFRILAIKEIIRNPEKYGFFIRQKHLYKEEPLRYVEVNETIRDLVDFAKDHGTNYKLLKRHNPWLRQEKLTIKNGKSYLIALPA
ncbi:MAG TPA: lytic transglycosylase domain-containing protein [Cyclobacteriaceae bacterium]|nr:lytic transglycosylase domain-containing protein [Cyclobacteriaceae bacterium]